MSEDEIIDVLDLIFEPIGLVEDRFREIDECDDFVSTSNGVTLLDAIAMRLQVIGECVKRLEKKAPRFLNVIPRSNGIKLHDFEIWFLITTSMWIMKYSMTSVRLTFQS